MKLAILVLLPILAGLAMFFNRHPTFNRRLLLAVAGIHALVAAGAIWRPPQPVLGGWLALDALGAFFLVIISALFLLVTVYHQGYLQPRPDHPELPHERFFVGCLSIFLGTMTLVAVSQNLGVMWVAVEATSLASAPLIFHHRSKASLEAAWKYLIICSVGIALALLGVVFLCTSTVGTPAQGTLNLSELLLHAHSFNPIWLKAAFVILFVGYGTKMGLAPMHTWLPDAHSEAPSGTSALLSGVLLNCAFLALLRAYQVCLAAGDAGYAGGLFLIFGLLSMLVSVSVMLVCSDYKRLLAYSSIEHMGIVALSIGLGPATWFFALYHTLCHSFCKGTLFLSAGNILNRTGTKQIRSVTGLLQASPIIGMVWIAGALAILGIPPSGLFISEFNILGGALRLGSAWQAAVVSCLFLLLLFIVFFAMGRAMLNMALGSPSECLKTSTATDSRWMTWPPLVLLSVVLILGVWLPEPVRLFIANAVAVLKGGTP